MADQYEPGSTFKVVTGAALELGKVTPQTSHGPDRTLSRYDKADPRRRRRARHRRRQT